MQTIINNNRRADIVFHPNGKIDLCARVVKTLNINDGDVIDILPHNDELYLYVKHRKPQVGKYKAQCRHSCKNGTHSRAWSKILTKAVRQHNGTTSTQPLRLCVGEETAVAHIDKALPIIYKMAL